MADKFKVTIDRDECIICGVCWSSCPEFFESGSEDELSQVVEEYQVDDAVDEGMAPADLEECVTEAADGCPVEIIHIQEA